MEMQRVVSDSFSSSDDSVGGDTQSISSSSFITIIQPPSPGRDKISRSMPNLDGHNALSTSSTQQQQQQQHDKKVGFVSWEKCRASACKGGKAGFVAMILQIVTLMWLRTTMTYQYRYNVGMLEAMHILWEEGGIFRFYRGFLFALIIGPLIRMGDTAANEGVKEFFQGKLPVEFTTLGASILAACWRIFLAPIDNFKTNLQVDGADGIANMMEKLAQQGIFGLWDGAFAIWLASAIGHYPWFVVNNKLEAVVPRPHRSKRNKTRLRHALIGLCSSVVSDTCSNSVKVLKTFKQTSNLSYAESLATVLKESGVTGLMFRGLKTRLLVNAIQGIMFSVLWKKLMETCEEKNIPLYANDKTAESKQKTIKVVR